VPQKGWTFPATLQGAFPATLNGAFPATLNGAFPATYLIMYGLCNDSLLFSTHPHKKPPYIGFIFTFHLYLYRRSSDLEESRLAPLLCCHHHA
jgi:hypothetical protein